MSLGYSCHMRVFIDEIGNADRTFYERHAFDWLGTPMWAICDLVENGFEGLADREQIKPRKFFVDKPTEYLTHERY